MAVGDIVPGYAGILSIDGEKIRCTDFGLNPKQEVEFYNHIIGLNDTITGNGSTKGEEPGSIQTQRIMYRPGVIGISGGFSAPVCGSTNSCNIGGIYGYAKDGSYFDMDMSYSCEGGRKYKDCRVNSFSLSCSAGDVASITVDVLALKAESGSSSSEFRDEQKIITWDKVEVTFKEIGEIFSIELSINNNANYVYTSSGVEPYDIRLGTQEVSGTISYYNSKGAPKYLDKDTVQAEGEIKLPGLAINLNCILKPITIQGSTSPVISAATFVGVGKALGD